MKKAKMEDASAMGIYDAEISKNAHLKDSLYERIQGDLPNGWIIAETRTWLRLQPPGAQLAGQGWKGHVSYSMKNQ